MIVLGLLLIVAGALLVILEGHLPSGGVLAMGGGVAVAAGTVLVLSGAAVSLFVAIPLSVLVGAVLVGVVLVLASKTRVALRAEVVTGPNALIGAPATVSNWDGLRGQVAVGGALWAARLDPVWEKGSEVGPGDTVVIENRHGLTLTVRPRQSWESL